MTRWLGAVVALWVGFSGVCLAAVTASATYLDEIRGNQEDPNLVVFRSTADEAWQAAVAGMDLAPGDSVWVKSGASAIVKVGGTAVMHLESDTVFTIPPDAADGDGAVRRVNLDSGSAWTTVEKLVNGQSFVVATKDAVGGVKGTQFHTSVDADGASDWDMEEGKLELAGLGDGGRRVMLGDGQNFRFLRGGRRAFDGPRPAGQRLAGLKQRFQQRFGTGLPNKAAVRQMLMQRSRRMARPMRRGMVVPARRQGLAQPADGASGDAGSAAVVRNGAGRPAAVRAAVVEGRVQNGGRERAVVGNGRGNAFGNRGGAAVQRGFVRPAGRMRR